MSNQTERSPLNDDTPADLNPPPVVAPRHLPVMLAEVLATLAPKAGETYIDATFGAGGYSTAILNAATCKVLALDRDIRAVRSASEICQRFPNRLNVVNAEFSRLDEIARIELSTHATDDQPSVFIAPDGVVLDIGVSSMQLDEAERGFSFQGDGPLDMRMSAPIDPLTGDVANDAMSAADFLNTAEEEQIANVIYLYGEEKKSRSIARAIVGYRRATPFTSTRELASLVSKVLGGRKEDGRHPATRTFQALRIHVNDELGELAQGLACAERILKPGGRLVVVTFHSLEDRIVKRFFTQRAGKESQGSRHLPPTREEKGAPSFQIVNSRPLSPNQAELDINPRARSARLRAGIRTSAAPLPLDLQPLGVPTLR
jgi:16S rRNA (cytosine1402-N4)-methyltransferase